MRHTAILLGIALLFGSSAQAYSNELVIYKKVFQAQALSGSVLVWTGLEPGAEVPGVLVEECSSDWKSVEASTKTDQLGHFALPFPAVKRIYHLRLSGYGFNTTLVTVRVRPGAKDKELSLRINLAF
jgi:hypothetical protein